MSVTGFRNKSYFEGGREWSEAAAKVARAAAVTQMNQDRRLAGHFCGLDIVYVALCSDVITKRSWLFAFIYQGHRVAWPEGGVLQRVCIGRKNTVALLWVPGQLSPAGACLSLSQHE